MRKVSTYIAPPALAVAAFLLFSGAQAPNTEERLWRHRNIGKAFFETPTTQAQSVGELKKAVDLAPNSARDRVNYGMALLRTGNTKESIVELEKAQKLDPTLPHSWFNLGIAYKREARYEDAIQQFQGMLRLVPDEPVSHYNLGLLYNLTGKEAEALKEFEIAAKLDDKLVAPRFQMYNVYRLLGKEDEAKKALAVFQDAKQRQKEADDSEDMEWSFWAELYDPIEAQAASPDTSTPIPVAFQAKPLPGAVDTASAKAEVLDLESDNKPDLIVWSKAGVLTFRGASVPVTNAGLANLTDVVSIAAGDYDNDELADLCVVTTTGASIFRNIKGRFEKTAIKLPAGKFYKALWVDYDHEYDLDLFLFGERSMLLRNEGNGVFAEQKFPFENGTAIDAAAFRVVPDTKGMDIAVIYADRDAVLYRDQMRGVFTPEPLTAVGRQVRNLRAADINNDSWIDLVFEPPSGGTAGVVVAMNKEGKFKATAIASNGAEPGLALADLENRGALDIITGKARYRTQGKGQLAPIPVSGLPGGVALAAADFDADGRVDVALAVNGAVQLASNRTAIRNHWMSVALTGIKNLKLSAGAEVEVKAGRLYQKLMYEGVPLHFGLRGHAAVDTIRISWPNGLIQNQPNEPAMRLAEFNEAPRLSGSCPMIFTWNGKRFEYIGDVLGTAPLGASAGDGTTFPVDHDEYIHLPEGSLAVREGQYEVRITEELREVSYIDEAKLIAVDHPSGVELFTNDKFKSPPFPEFRLFGVSQRIYPVAARDHRGADVLPQVVRKDRVYPTAFRRDFMGKAELHTLDLDFGDAARGNRAVLVLSGWVDWADGSTFMNASQQPGGGLVFPYLQVRDAAGHWQTVIEDMGIPSGTPKTIVVDLTGKFLSASREVRIVTNLCLYWDQIFLSESITAPGVRITPAGAAAADIRLRGFSRPVVHPTREQPEAFEYQEWMPVSMWNPTPGLYTRYGDVRELMVAADDRYVIMGSGDEIRLSFDAEAYPALPTGWKRDFLLLVDGWSKDGDLNTAYAQSVEPLPFHGMSSYPYPAGERFPDTLQHREWREKYNTRPALKLIKPLVRRAD
ncbi:MAG TPA: tetratricopeptide repeat protein [Bryobacteraceae bacterium]|nr:tetratricopeptide repeat protein [Bryobacteraceae bacterium]